MPPYIVSVAHPVGTLDPSIDLDSLSLRQKREIYQESADRVEPFLKGLHQLLRSVGLTPRAHTLTVEDVENPNVSVVVFLDDDSMAMDLLEFLTDSFCKHCKVTVKPLSSEGLANFSERPIR